MGDATPAARGAVIDGVLLALSHSKLQPLARRDALRSVLHIDYTDLVKDDTVHLQGLWNLLQEEPEFDAAAAVAPMCTMKGWSEYFGMEVELPEHLRSLSEREVALKTTECNVPTQELRKVFDAAGRRARRTTNLAQHVSVEGLGGGATSSRPASWRDNPLVGWVSGGVAVVALLFLAISSFGECRSAEWESVNPGQHVVGIPVVSAHKFGAQVGAVLDDPKWLELPEAERRSQMESTLRGLDGMGIEAFFVKDGSGRIRATAQWFANRSRIDVQFR